MVRKYQAVKARASTFPPTWWMRQNLEIGPGTVGPLTEESYQSLERKGFATLEELKAYWLATRGRLLAEYGEEVLTWWAAKEYRE
jgi:hypothetical protein